MNGDPQSSPTIRLAILPGNNSNNILTGEDGVRPIAHAEAPAILVSYHYIEPFLESRKRYVIRDWSMDSGAFSAHSQGIAIDLDAYTELAQELLATDPQLTEIFGLDVIGDWRAGVRNVERMWSAGVPCIPTYHYGEPEAVLLGLARDYPKIALGGAVGLEKTLKTEWARQCFARVWPKPIHGLGFGSTSNALDLPWHSIDASSWELQPLRFGMWKKFGHMTVRRQGIDLSSQLDWFARLERRARAKWADESKLLESMLPADCRKWPRWKSLGGSNGST